MNKTEAIKTPSDAPYEPLTPTDAFPTQGIVRPTGISWVTVTLGLLCLGVAALVLTVQLTDVGIDWSTAAPVFVVGAGALLVIAGLASMTTQNRHDT